MNTASAITILGSTGSIGQNALDVISRHPDKYRVVALTANTDVDALEQQCLRWQPDYAVIPSAVYTVPALSSVGLTEKEAEEAGIAVKVTTVDMSDWFAAKTYAETLAWSKVLVDAETGQIVGAHLIGHHSEELIHLFALAMRHGIAASALKDTLFAFPTFAADLKSMI